MLAHLILFDDAYMMMLMMAMMMLMVPMMFLSDDDNTLCLMFSMMILTWTLAAEDTAEEGQDPGTRGALYITAHCDELDRFTALNMKYHVVIDI